MTSSPTSSSILTPPSTTTDTNPEEDIFIRIQTDPEPGLPERVTVVTCNSVEWEGYHPSCPRPNQTIRCLSPAFCNGITTGGHRRCLITLACWNSCFEVKVFTKLRNNVHILLQMDNRSSVSYVHKMGGTHSLNLALQARHLWEWRLQRRILLTEENLSGVTTL